MRRRKLGSRVLTPDAGGVKKYMERLGNKISLSDANLCRRVVFSIGGTIYIDGWDERLPPPGRPARRQSTAGVSGTDTNFPCTLPPSSERRRARQKSFFIRYAI